MDNILNIIKSYNRIKDELDKIDNEIRNSDFATDSELKPPAHNFFTNVAIFIVNVSGEAARIEPDIIEAEFACDPDMKRIDQCVENLSGPVFHPKTKIAYVYDPNNLVVGFKIMDGD